MLATLIWRTDFRVVDNHCRSGLSNSETSQEAGDEILTGADQHPKIEAIEQ